MKIFSTCVLALITIIICGCGDGRIGRAQKLLENGDATRAMALVSEEISENPESADAYLLSALIKESRGEWSEATKDFEIAKKINPSRAHEIAEYLVQRTKREPATLIGHVVSQDNELPGEDASYLQTALKLDPSLVNNEDFAYEYYVKHHQGPEKFVQLFPNSDRALQALLNQAYVLNEQAGDVQAAKDILEKLVSHPRAEAAGVLEAAKRALEGLWTSRTATFGFRSWISGGKVNEGERIKLTVEDQPRIHDLGAFGNRVVDGQNVVFFIGTREEWQLIVTPESHFYSLDLRPETRKRNEEIRQRRSNLVNQLQVIGNNGWEGDVPRDGEIFFKAHEAPGWESETFTVKIYTKI